MREYRDLRGCPKRGIALMTAAGKAKELPKGTLCYSRHPFGLLVPEGCDGIYFVTEGSGCDMNVKATTSLINQSLDGSASMAPPKLRMITIREVEDWAERRFFFEVCFSGLSYIGGGGTYYSGHGGDMTRQMRSVLLAIGTIYGLDIEEETIFADQVELFGPQVLQDLRTELRSFVEPNRTAARKWVAQFKR